MRSGHPNPSVTRRLAALRASVTATVLLPLLLAGAAQAQGAAKTSTTQGTVEAAAPVALTVAVAPPAEEAWAVSVPASGWLEPWAEASIGAEISGARVTEVLVDVGQAVSKGEVLARLDDSAVRADLRRQEAAVAQAQAAYDNAHAAAERARRLSDTGAVSGTARDEAVAAEIQAEATLASQVAALESAELQVARTEVVAADDGVISAVSAELGQVASPGTELFRLIRQGRIEWQAEVSPRFLPELREGLTAVVEGPMGAIEGTVRLVSPTVDQTTGRIMVYVDLPQEFEGIQPRAGLFASGAIQVEERPALTVPQSAIVLRDGYSYVYTVNPDATVSRVKVTTDRRQGDRVEVAEGLPAEARVVQSGGAFLSDGVTVRVVGEAHASASGDALRDMLETMAEGPAAPTEGHLQGTSE